MTPLFAVVGWKNSGKTTLIERLVAEFAGRGLAVGTVKHTHQAFAMDVPGTDTDRHRRAGARRVMMVGRDGWTLAARAPEPSLADALARIEGCDLVVAEGFKRASVPMIEVVADPAAPPIREENAHVFLVAADCEVATALPVLSRSAVVSIADAALEKVGLA